MRISDWSSDVCSSDLRALLEVGDDLGDLDARRGDAVAADPQQLGSSADPGGEDVDVDRVVLDLAEDALELAEGGAVADLVGVGGLGGGGGIRHRRPPETAPRKIGSASCRDRVCLYVANSGVAVSLKKK